jgi:hypothetical protein
MAGTGPTEPERPSPDRYESLPGIAGLPRWILGKMAGARGSPPGWC